MVPFAPQKLINREGLQKTITKYNLGEDQYWMAIIKSLHNNNRIGCICETWFATICQLRANGAAKRTSIPSSLMNHNRRQRRKLETKLEKHDLQFHPSQKSFDIASSLETFAEYDHSLDKLSCWRHNLCADDLATLDEVTSFMSDSIALTKQIDLLELSCGGLTHVEDTVTQVLNLEPWKGIHESYYMSSLSLPDMREMFDGDDDEYLTVCFLV